MRKAVLFLLAATCLLSPTFARAQEKIIVVGFVGGFVHHDDAKHAEVQFAARLRERYRSAIDVEVFNNHSGSRALRSVLHLMAAYKSQAKIIIFGHSWGGTETVRLARALDRKGIPVLLTIQIDSIPKPGQENFTIPANVANAVNFYQTAGWLHGRAEILAENPMLTKIIGNFEMTYKDHPINCEDFPWFSRVFTKPHLEIENDPRVWSQAAMLIDGELSGSRATAKASLPASTY